MPLMRSTPGFWMAAHRCGTRLGSLASRLGDSEEPWLRTKMEEQANLQVCRTQIVE